MFMPGLFLQNVPASHRLLHHLVYTKTHGSGFRHLFAPSPVSNLSKGIIISALILIAYWFASVQINPLSILLCLFRGKQNS